MKVRTVPSSVARRSAEKASLTNLGGLHTLPLPSLTGVDTTARSGAAYTALEWAVINGKEDIADMLRKAGVRILFKHFLLLFGHFLYGVATFSTSECDGGDGDIVRSDWSALCAMLSPQYSGSDNDGASAADSSVEPSAPPPNYGANRSQRCSRCVFTKKLSTLKRNLSVNNNCSTANCHSYVRAAIMSVCYKENVT